MTATTTAALHHDNLDDGGHGATADDPPSVGAADTLRLVISLSEPRLAATGRPAMSRRRFLGRSGSVAAGASALAAVGGMGALLTACGRSPVAPDLVALFSPDRILAAGRPQRIPFAIVAPGDRSGVVLPDDDGVVGVELTRGGVVIDGIDVAGRVVSHDHVGDVDPAHQHADLFRYYPARLTLPEPGVYDLVVSITGTGTGSSGRSTVSASLPVQAFDPAEVTVPLPGDPMPVVTTPTWDDRAGVDRICTRVEPCPFHHLDFALVVGRGQPTALLVATPAYCSTAYCGPVLDTLIEASASAPGVTIVHAEVYANVEQVGGNLADPALRLAPAVDQIGLTFEPSLFLIDSTGTLVDRIDNVFDLTESTAALAALR